MHGAAAVERDLDGAGPLGEVSGPAIDSRTAEDAELNRPAMRLGGDVAPMELVRCRPAERAINVADMPPEEVVELTVVVRRVVLAIPPEPVAAFRNEQFLAGAGERLWRR